MSQISINGKVFNTKVVSTESIIDFSENDIRMMTIESEQLSKEAMEISTVFNAIQAMASAESFGYQSTEGVGQNISKFLTSVVEHILKGLRFIKEKVIAFFRFIRLKLKALFGKLTGKAVITDINQCNSPNDIYELLVNRGMSIDKAKKLSLDFEGSWCRKSIIALSENTEALLDKQISFYKEYNVKLKQYFESIKELNPFCRMIDKNEVDPNSSYDYNAESGELGKSIIEDSENLKKEFENFKSEINKYDKSYTDTLKEYVNNFEGFNARIDKIGSKIDQLNKSVSDLDLGYYNRLLGFHSSYNLNKRLSDQNKELYKNDIQQVINSIVPCMAITNETVASFDNVPKIYGAMYSIIQFLSNVKTDSTVLMLDYKHKIRLPESMNDDLHKSCIKVLTKNIGDSSRLVWWINKDIVKQNSLDKLKQILKECFDCIRKQLPDINTSDENNVTEYLEKRYIECKQE